MVLALGARKLAWFQVLWSIQWLRRSRATDDPVWENASFPQLGPSFVAIGRGGERNQSTIVDASTPTQLFLRPYNRMRQELTWGPPRVTRRLPPTVTPSPCAAFALSPRICT